MSNLMCVCLYVCILIVLFVRNFDLVYGACLFLALCIVFCWCVDLVCGVLTSVLAC